MNLESFDGRNRAWALYAARLCGRAYTPQQTDGLAAALEQVCGEGTEVGFRLLERGVPATIRGVGRDGVCIVISGITQTSQGSAIFAAYEELLVNSSTKYFASWFYNCAVQLIRQLRLDGHVPNRDVFIFGHSGGGAIAIALAALLRPLNPRHEIHVVTFGAPRVCTEPAFLGLFGMEITRWMNIGDDVPQFPPRIGDLTDQSFLVFLPQVFYWQRFVHLYGGLVLDRLGNVSSGVVPPLTRLLSYLTIPVNYISQNSLFGNDHSIGEYVRRLASGLPPKIPGVLPKLKGAFDVGELPAMFQALTIDIPMSLPIPIQGGVERSIQPDVVELEISRRQAFILEPIKRC